MRQGRIFLIVLMMLVVSLSDGWAQGWRFHSRHHLRQRYETPREPAVAGMLSFAVPGLGQMYAGSPGKGVFFLIAETTLFTAAAIQIDRALYYDDLADRYDLFYDRYSDSYLSYEQGYDRARGHGFLGVGLLLTGVGLHLWNVQDAVQTAERYNQRYRLSLEMRLRPEPTLACRVPF